MKVRDIIQAIEEFAPLSIQEGYRVHHKMIVKMISVNVGGDDHFPVAKALRQFHTNVMGLLRG